MAAERNVIQQTFDNFGKSAAMVKQSGTWYRNTNDVIQAMNLQKSQYGPSYYVNVGWWLRSLGDVKFPKDHQWHIGIRLESLAANRAEEIKALMDLESGISERERGRQLHELFESELRPALDRTRSVDGLRALRREGRLKAAAVRGPAILILDEP
jgi:meiotically up-regulated gene 157 (Mug157) protein